MVGKFQGTSTQAKEDNISFMPQKNFSLCRPSQMAVKMKGIFKGLRIFSHMFAQKEHEMEIGFPTDVKHVAHIGLGTSDTSPSWGSNCQNSEANDIATVEILIEILQSTLTVEMHRHGNGLHMEGAILKLLALIYNRS
ncbi:CRIB domain-containing protein RIC4-like isoform X2 [Hordeum vulgare subsp. vulgare]|uniref:CRIB domain-containing protein RIC4-like isoform X2 n=1 Tax=Hordeum vulgare subsp. vulgare TaxID=112509 RepID=UPI001D1A408E|nr:CRIB domain-containing protein RIC4-like isoform X2 [Hordeum vulgare subsp. vulgare]